MKNSKILRLPKKGAGKRLSVRLKQIIEEAKEFTQELADKINKGENGGKKEKDQKE